jgi:hypothetical protein
MQKLFFVKYTKLLLTLNSLSKTTFKFIFNFKFTLQKFFLNMIGSEYLSEIYKTL